MRHNKFAVLEQLLAGEYCSGEALAQQLGVSRTSIANYIKQLQKLGLDIYKVKGRGYRLAQPLSLLDIDALQYAFPRQKIVRLDEVDSTNAWIQRNLKHCRHGQVVLAEYQSAGKGRRGRQWQTPFAGQLAMSLLWEFDKGIEAMSGLSLAVGLAVVETLSKLGHKDLSLKWPNDIYQGGRKLGGILIELQGHVDGLLQMVVGLGINVHVEESHAAQIDQPFTQLQHHELLDRNELARALITALNRIYIDFDHDGFAPLVARWQQFDAFCDQKVNLLFSNERVERGIARGIDEQGALLLEQDGKIKRFFGGEVSLRAAKSS
ncbi:bifunctional biotin--[acetyl-CoA-carboxylase] ligase/biotin operon repressor BirA [Aliagarivorans taiwanensis]|uniref:bifunctional biotin--[acetyl-CoA-carboxylase] ligase/biotin operon repressor BirA n=1 Tax=Aliagarivorans taiwanensis TaxID=561966 RepID=UPI000420A23F|nr:bifunctional biotin--[acetyl-CoA-carboxylase] ligase/biotin operon repressor BirA [Aliagarivorans taiwanensis]